MAIQGLELSTNVTKKNVKLLFWGKTGSRKTETVLRNFPHVLIIDAEGNSDQCVDVPEIKPFLRVKTKDTRQVMEIIDKVANGEVKFPDGSPVETVCIDSVSILWSVQQEVAAKSAEKRAEKYNKPKDEATLTQLDWVMAKRPMKRLSNRFNGTNIKFLVLIGREKDLYDENGNDLKKIGVTADVMKGTEYDMSACLHFYFDGNGKWTYEVTGVKGSLGQKIFPMHSKGNVFPMSELLDYSRNLKPDAKNEATEDEIAESIVSEENQERTWSAMLAYAKKFDITQEMLGNILRGAGFQAFKVSDWDEMKDAIDKWVSVQSSQPSEAEKQN